MIGSQDLLVGLILALFFFGAKRLPELASSLGKSMKEFKKAVESRDEDGGSAKTGTSDVPALAPPQALCGTCQSPLASEWRHCPRCGAPTAT